MYIQNEKCLNSLRPFVPIEEQQKHIKEIKKFYNQTHIKENNKQKKQ